VGGLVGMEKRNVLNQRGLELGPLVLQAYTSRCIDYDIPASRVLVQALNAGLKKNL
jgi:hypothetical protein